MKALKSELAKRVLADRGAREQLREVVTSDSRARQGRAPGVIVMRDRNGVHRSLTVTVVPKAA